MLFSYFRNARVLNLGGGPKTIKINLKSIFMLGFWKWGSVHWSFKEDGEQPLLHGWFNVSFWQPRMLQLRFSWHIGGTGLDDFSERYVFTCTLLCHGCFKSFQCIWMIFLINLQKYRKEKRWGQNKNCSNQNCSVTKILNFPFALSNEVDFFVFTQSNSWITPAYTDSERKLKFSVGFIA